MMSFVLWAGKNLRWISHLWCMFSFLSRLFLFCHLHLSLLLIHPFYPMASLPPNIGSAPTPELLFTADPFNCSSWDQPWAAPYLAHLDVQLYQDFYAVWVSLMVG